MQKKTVYNLLFQKNCDKLMLFFTAELCMNYKDSHGFFPLIFMQHNLRHQFDFADRVLYLL